MRKTHYLQLFYLLTLCFWLLCPSIIHAQSSKWKKKSKHDLKDWEKLSNSLAPKNFVLFGGGFILNGDNSIIFKIPEQDTNTLSNVFSDPRRISVAPFALSEREVTNNQYRSFLLWVIDSIALNILAQKDPSYYLDPATKQLNWSKKNDVHDTTRYSLLYPLYKIVTDSASKLRGKYRLDPDRVKYAFRSSSKLGVGSLPVYPDTLCWYRDDVQAYDNMRKYFFHPYFGNYPVVGVSWEQAQAYCDWLSRSGGFEFRLPKSIEFQSAYSKPFNRPAAVRERSQRRGEELMSGNSGYPWNRYELFNSKGKYMANFGSIRDDYGHQIKEFGMDGAFFTSPTGAYAPSISGLYDLAGNVAEWVSDTILPEYKLSPPRIFSSRDKKEIDSSKYYDVYLYASDSLQIIIDKMFENVSMGYSEFDRSLRGYWKDLGSPVVLPKDAYFSDTNHYILSGNTIRRPIKWIDKEPSYYENIRSVIEFATEYYYNLQVIASFSKARYVMGGSWKDGPLFLRYGIKKVYGASTTSSFIGFRVAADVTVTPELQSFLKTPTQFFPVRRTTSLKKS